MRYKFGWGLIFLLISLLSINIQALAENSPLPMLQSTANKIIAELRQNKSNLHSNPSISFNIVTKYLLPLVDQEAMAQAVLGRNAWNTSTASQRSQFIQQFRILVIRTYAAAFSEFTDEKVQFMPIRGGVNDQQTLTVNSQILRTGGEPINVTYRLSLEGARWKIIDFSVDGISMVQSFQSQFQSQLTQSGMEGLIASLTAHNKKNS